MRAWIVLTANYIAALGIVFVNKWLYKERVQKLRVWSTKLIRTSRCVLT